MKENVSECFFLNTVYCVQELCRLATLQ